MGFQSSKIEEPIITESEYRKMACDEILISYQHIKSLFKNKNDYGGVKLSDQDIERIQMEIDKLNRYINKTSSKIDFNFTKSEYLKNQLENEKQKIEKIKKIISDLDDSKKYQDSIFPKISYIDCTLQSNLSKEQCDDAIFNLFQQYIQQLISVTKENDDLELVNQNLIQEIDKINKEGIALFNQSVKNV